MDRLAGRPLADALARHRGCMACGASEDNPASLGLRFRPTAAGGVVAGFRPGPDHRSWDDRMHGGLIATLIDAAMTNALLVEGIAAVTVDLSIRFVAPARIGVDLKVSAERLGSRHGVHSLIGRVHDGDRLIARATAKFMAL